jgi:hypothetical protein
LERPKLDCGQYGYCEPTQGCVCDALFVGKERIKEGSNFCSQFSIGYISILTIFIIFD